eukprot:scaffold1228_cov246-Pinguiococcus_pyrenoidosus.AAC.11
MSQEFAPPAFLSFPPWPLRKRTHLGDEVALRVTVLARLGRRDVLHLAGAVLDHDVSTLADLTRFHGDGEGRACDQRHVGRDR